MTMISNKPILKTIFKYAIPNVISMWIFTLYTMIDGVFISRFVGSTALAGVNLALPLINFIFSISIMIGVGSSTLIAIKFGENKYDEGNKIFTLATFLNLFLGIFISAIILLNIDRVINILGANKNQEVYKYVKEYLTIIVCFSLFYMSGYAFEIYIKIDGKPSYPAICVLVGGFTNLILDYVFVVIFHYGVTGAAIATGISQVISCTMLFLYIVLKAKYIKFKNLEGITMKKMLLLMILALSVFMCSIQKEEKKGEKNADGIPKKIVVGLDDSFVPMGFKNEKGEIVGFDIDLARAVAQKLGAEVEFKPINWDSKILDLNGGNIDLIWNGLTITDERKKETEMTKPYLTSHQLIITKTGSNIKTKADLKGKIVGSQSESSGEEAVKKSGEDKTFKEFKTYAQYDQAFMDLDAGRIDAIIADEVLAKYTKKTKEIQANKELYKILNDNYGEEEYGIAAKKGNIKLIEAINKAIEELKADGTYQKIYLKWFKD